MVASSSGGSWIPPTQSTPQVLVMLSDDVRSGGHFLSTLVLMSHFDAKKSAWRIIAVIWSGGGGWLYGGSSVLCRCCPLATAQTLAPKCHPQSNAGGSACMSDISASFWYSLFLWSVVPTLKFSFLSEWCSKNKTLWCPFFSLFWHCGGLLFFFFITFDLASQERAKAKSTLPHAVSMKLLSFISIAS